MSLSGKVAIVTGGTRGIGRSIVEAIADAGAQVAFTYAHNKTLADEIADGDRIVAFEADAADSARAAETVKEIRSRFGRIDILVNNAGITRDRLLVRMSEADWDAVMDTNLKGVYNFTKPAVAAMLKQRSGTILNISSISGLTGMPGQANYSASKAGMIGFTKALAKEVAKANITVNALALGLIETDMTAALRQDYRDKALEQIPLGRFGQVSEVARIATFDFCAAFAAAFPEVSGRHRSSCLKKPPILPGRSSRSTAVWQSEHTIRRTLVLRHGAADYRSPEPLITGHLATSEDPSPINALAIAQRVHGDWLRLISTLGSGRSCTGNLARLLIHKRGPQNMKNESRSWQVLFF